MLKELGKGSFGKVKLVIDVDHGNKQYAMKQVRKKKKIKGYLQGKMKTEMEDVM